MRLFSIIFTLFISATSVAAEGAPNHPAPAGSYAAAYEALGAAATATYSHANTVMLHGEACDGLESAQADFAAISDQILAAILADEDTAHLTESSNAANMAVLQANAACRRIQDAEEEAEAAEVAADVAMGYLGFARYSQVAELTDEVATLTGQVETLTRQLDRQTRQIDNLLTQVHDLYNTMDGICAIERAERFPEWASVCGPEIIFIEE